jgi:PAS domain S-box-containing protein
MQKSQPQNLRARVSELERELAEAHRTAANLREDLERYRGIVEEQTDMLTRYGSDFVLTFANDACARASRATPQQMLGRSFLPFLAEADRSWVAESILALTPEQSVCAFAHRVEIGGEVRWHHWTNRAIFDERGKLVEYQAVGRDITARKQIEQELERQNQELNRANKALEKLHREKDALIAMVSHELRTPLVTGLGYLDMLLSGALGPISETVAAKMSVARKNLSRLSRLIEDLLDYQQLLLGPKRAISLMPVDMKLLMEDVRAETLATHSVAAERLLVEVVSDLRPALASREMLRRALVNLVDNSIKHGGADCQVRLQARAGSDNSVYVCVSDNGVGIPVALKDRVFDLFVTSGETSGGRGLGLAIVRAILNAHSARFELRSEPGQGTSVGFWLTSAGPNQTAPLAAEGT